MNDYFVNNKLCNLLNIKFPLIQAGMGGISGPNLVSAVSNAGCAGVIGLYKLQGDEIINVVKATADKTPRTLGLNLIPELSTFDFLRNQLEIIFKTSISNNIFLLFYGLPNCNLLNEFKTKQIPWLVQVGTVDDARKALEAGFDGIILQGIEAGGHLLGDQELRCLLKSMKQITTDNKPIIAAGGISSGSDFANLFKQGIDGVLCGTIFVATFESDAHQLYKERIVQSTAEDTLITGLYEIGWQGRKHRILKNKLTATQNRLPSSFIAAITVSNKKYLIPRYSATVPTNNTTGKIDEMAMYCGQSCRSVNRLSSVDELIYAFMNEFYEEMKDRIAQ